MDRRKLIVGGLASIGAVIANIRGQRPVQNEYLFLVKGRTDYDDGWQFQLEKIESKSEHQYAYAFTRRPWPMVDLMKMELWQTDAMILTVEHELIDRGGAGRTNDHILYEFERFKRESLKRLDTR